MDPKSSYLALSTRNSSGKVGLARLSISVICGSHVSEETNLNPNALIKMVSGMMESSMIHDQWSFNEISKEVLNIGSEFDLPNLTKLTKSFNQTKGECAIEAMFEEDAITPCRLIMVSRDFLRLNLKF